MRAEKIAAGEAEDDCDNIPFPFDGEDPMGTCDQQLRQIREIVGKIEHDMDRFVKTRTSSHLSYTIVRIIEQIMFYVYIGLLFILVIMFFYHDWY